MAIFPYNLDLKQGLASLVQFMHEDSSSVAPSSDSILKCASKNDYRDAAEALSGTTFALSQSDSPECYPISEAFNLVL